MRYASCLTTFAAVNRQLAKADPGATPSAAQSEYANYFAYLRDILYSSGAWLSRYVERTFVPERYTDTFYFADLTRTQMARGDLTLRDDVLELHAVTWDGAELANTSYRMLDATLQTSRILRFSPQASLSVNASDFSAGVEVDATWCFHAFAPDAWTQVDASVTLANTTATSISVTDGTAYEVLQYLRCEDELMHITAISSNTLTVRRAVNGSTAAAHTAQPLERFNVQADIALAATRIAAFLYERRTAVGNVAQVLSGAVVMDALPDEAKTIINYYRYLPIGVP